MKKKSIIFLAAFFPSMLMAQVCVDSLGYVSMPKNLSVKTAIAIGDNNIASQSKFVVNTNGEQFVTSKMQGDMTVLKIVSNTANPTIPGYTDYSKGIEIVKHIGSTYGDIGIRVSGTGASTSWSMPFIGMYSSAYGLTSGRSVGILGEVSGYYSGAAIMGSTTAITSPYQLSMNTRYAGLFYGDVAVSNGTISGTLTSESDARLKEDVRELGTSTKNEVSSTLNTLDRLTPISFRYKSDLFMRNMINGMLESSNDLTDTQAVTGDDISESISEICKNNPVLQKTHYGFLAQEVQQVYPDLVYENTDGYLSVNYVELVPILMQAIKELKAEVDNLKSNGNNRKARLQDVANSEETDDIATEEIVETASMDQNIPNPFTDKTDIPIYLPETVKSATLYIYDLSGKQLEQHAIEGRGEAMMTIHADKMNAGMYIYSLIADGKVITSKKMIVVK